MYPAWMDSVYWEIYQPTNVSSSLFSIPLIFASVEPILPAVGLCYFHITEEDTD